MGWRQRDWQPLPSLSPAASPAAALSEAAAAAGSVPVPASALSGPVGSLFTLGRPRNEERELYWAAQVAQ